MFIENELNNFLQNNKQVEMFGQFNDNDTHNYFKIIKYQKYNKIYINAYYGNKKIEIFKKTKEAVDEFIKFALDINDINK